MMNLKKYGSYVKRKRDRQTKTKRQRRQRQRRRDRDVETLTQIERHITKKWRAPP